MLEKCDTCMTRYVCEEQAEFYCKQRGYSDYTPDSRMITQLSDSKAIKVYVILYQDLWLNTCKVSQEGYKTLSEAQTFCEKRLGMDVKPENPAIFVEGSGGRYTYSNGVTKEKYTIVEVTI